MAYTTVPYVNSGNSWSAAQHNTYIKDNFSALWPFTAAGDIAITTASNDMQKIAIGADNTVLTIFNDEPVWLYQQSAYCSLGVSTMTISNASWTTLEYDVVNRNMLDMFLPEHPQRIYAPKTGIYNLFGGIYWESNDLQTREVLYYSNYEDKEYYIDTQNGINTSTNNISVPIYLTVGSFIEVYVYQGSGSSLGVSANISMIYWGS